MKKLSLIVIFVMFAIITMAQLTVQNGLSAQQLGNNLAGANISVSNATITGANVQFGTFNFAGSGFPLSTGVVLSSGSIFDSPGPNSSSGTGTDLSQPGSDLLDAISGMPTNDAVELKFDFTVQSDKIEFNYIFASEEYNEYVGSFNDVFAFFISGPGIVGEENIAVVPNTTVPVAINNINLDSYWQYYNDNESGYTNIEFDGYTTVLTAKKEGLIPCQTYTLKLIIADAGDGAYDSGVFLQENSLVQGSISASTNTYSENDIALEGCVNASFTINLDSAQNTNTYIRYAIGGTAVNGIDYSYIDSVLVIPIGQTSATIIVDALTDGISEGLESVELIYEPILCQGYDTIVMYIQDYQALEFQTIPTDLSCNGSNDGQLDFNITGGESPYSINLTDSATGIMTTFNSFPITGLSAGTYQIQVLDAYGCWAEDIVAGAIFDADTTFLPDGNGVSYSTSINISGLPVGQTLVDVNQLQSICLTMEHSFMGDLLIQLETPNGTLLTLKQQPGGSTSNLGEPVASGPNDSHSEILTPGVGYQYCFTSNPTYGTIVGEANQHTYTYVSQTGETLSDKYAPAGSYESYEPLSDLIGTPLNGAWTIIVTDEIPNNNGYIFNWSISIAADRPDSIITLTQPSEPEITGATTLPSCGSNNGAISLTIIGGNSPFTYNWSNGATTQNISNVPAGSHNVTVTDALGCTFIKTFSLPNSSAASISSSVSNETCVDANNGSISLTLTGGTPPYSYLWSSGQTTEDVNSLNPGNYSVQISDFSGCVSASNFEILAANPLFVSSTITNESCGNIDGVVDLSVIGGVSPYTYIWSNSFTTQDIDGLQQGVYNVTVSDANMCTKASSYNVINLVGDCIPDCDLAIQNVTSTDEICGNANGSVQLDIYTTNLPYLVAWNNGANTEDLTGIGEGSYDVTITDAENCIVNQSFIVSNLVGSLAISSVSINDELCGNASGGIDITPSGGVQPYYYNWSNGATSQDLINLNSGIYSLTLTDANLCAIHETYEVNNNTGTLELVYGNAMNSDCGQANGSIDINISGGNYPISYHWSNGANSQDLIGVLPGGYTCTITDGSDCDLITPEYIVGNNSGTMAFTYINAKNEVCENDEGEIKILVSGGATPYIYYWSNGATTQNIYNLSAGTYSGTITDNLGCSITTGNVNVINVPGTLVLESVSSINEICSNGLGSVQIDISGGTTPYTFCWNTGSVSQNLFNLSEGAYSCYVSDSVGCYFTVNANVQNEQGSLNIENFVVTDEICGNGTGSINLIISGGLNPITYSWSSGNNTEDLNLLNSGIYAVSVEDSQGCLVSGSTQVSNQAGNLNVEIQSMSNEVCGAANGAINISLTGGVLPYTYSWSNGSITEDISNLSAAVYSCTISDNSGCSVSIGNILINNSAGLMSISNPIISNENCGNSNGAIDISVNGGVNPLTYLWSNAAVTQDISGLTSDYYQVTVSDAGNCTVTGNYFVGESSGTLAYSNIQIVDEVCGNNNGSINLAISGGSAPYLFSWSNGSSTQNISSLSSGDYTLTTTDNTGCSIQTNVLTINDNSGNFALVSISESDASCGSNNGSINVSLSGGALPISYIWNNGSLTQNISSLPSGIYSCTATDNLGCELNYSTVIQNDAGNLTASGATTMALCGASNGAVDITITGGTTPYTYTWNNGTTNEDLINLSSGNYTVFVEDATGCYLNQTYNVASSGAVEVSAVNIADENCGNTQGGIEIIVSGGTQPYQYEWSTNTSVSCCDYTLELYDNYGYGWNYAYVGVSVNGEIINYFTTYGGNLIENIPVCTGDIIGLNFYSGYDDSNVSYSLVNSNGETVFSDGPYPMNGNSYSGVSSCTFNPPNSNVLTNLGAGDYSVEITDFYGCNTSASATIDNNSGGFTISSNVVTNDFCNSNIGAVNITVVGGSPSYQYIWSNGSTSQDISGLASGTYTVFVTDANGCQISGTYEILNNTGTLGYDTAMVDDTYCGSSNGAIDITVYGDEVPISFLWNNGATTEDLSNVNSGSYIVTITDASGCSIIESFEIINQTNGLSLDFTEIQPMCGNNDGEIDMSISGGFSPYSIYWDNGAVTEDILNLFAGTYSVSVSDSTSCIATETIVLSGTSSVNISSMNVTDENCGNSDGSISAIASGGDYPYNYQWALAENSTCCDYYLYLYDLSSDGWNGSSVEVLINGTILGTYTLFTDFSTTFNIPICTDDVIQLNYNEVSDGADNYIYLVDISGNIVYDVGPYPNNGFLYSGTTSCSTSFPSSSSIYGLSEGVYAVTITDANGCVDSDTATVINNTNGFEITSIIKTDDYCNSGTGTISIGVTGGEQPYMYYWSNGETSQNLSGISQGTYTVTIYDSYYCKLEETILVNNDPGTLAFGAFSINDTYCGDNTGGIDITATGLSIPFTYSWSNGETTEDLSNIVSGSYIVTITDNTGCQIQDTFIVVNQTNGLSLAFVETQPTCGNSDASIDMTISGGVLPYSVLWSNNSTTEDLTNISGGTYVVTVTDATSCMTNETINLSTNTGVVINSMNVTDEYCGNSNGSISVSASGGSYPYSYEWQMANSSCCSYGMYLYDVNGDGWIGSYVDVQVNDVSIGTYTLTSGSYIYVTIPVCTNDDLKLYYTSGSNDEDNYVYLLDVQGNWILYSGPSPSEGLIYSGTSTCEISLPNSSYIEYISAGEYSVTVTDANGCYASDSAIVLNSTNGFVVSSVDKVDEYCNNNSGSIDLSVSGGLEPYQYYWSNGANTQNLSGLSSGIYTVTIYDDNYCMLEETVTIVNNLGTLAFGISSITDTYCGSLTGAIDVTILGDETPFVISWNNGATTEDLNNILSGDYQITVTDASGCVIQDNFTVTNQTNGLSLSSTTTEAFCGNNDGAINLTVTGGSAPYVIIWSNGTTTEDLTNVIGGLYTVTVTDATSCSTHETITLNDSGTISIISLDVTDEICDNSEGAITVIATGGTTPYIYEWSQTITSPCCSYTLQMFDSFGDDWNGGYLEVVINSESMGTFYAVGNGSTETFDVCNGDVIELNYSSGSWDEENSYELLNSSGDVVFSDGPSPSVGPIYSGTTSCEFTPSSTNHLSNLDAGDYELTITESNGCTYSTSITVNNSTGNFNILSVNTIDDNCGNYNGSIDISVSGGSLPYTYLWSNGANTEDIINITAGEYTVSITDNFGCQIIETNTVENIAGTLDISNVNITETYCGNNAGAIDISISGGSSPYTYLWSNGAVSQDLTSIYSGVYDVTVTDNVDCNVFGSYTIQNLTNGLEVIFTSTNEICSNSQGSINLVISGGVAPYLIEWSNGETEQNISGLSEGVYTYTVTDNSGCSQSESITIQNTQGNMFVLLDDIQNDYCGWGYGSINISVQGGDAPFTYQWSNGYTTQDISYVVFGNYSVTATDVNGCTDIENYEIGYQADFEVTDTIIQNSSCVNCADGSIDVTTNSGFMMTYQWSNFETTEDIYNLESGEYSVTMTDENGCMISETYFVTFPISYVNPSDLSNYVKFFPNPSKGIVNVSFDLKNNSEIMVEVYNMIGELVFISEKQSDNEGKITIDLSNAVEGVYMFRVNAGKQYIAKRILIMRK